MTDQVEATAIVTRPEQQQALAPQSLTPQELLSLAVQQGADTQKLKELMDLQERWQKDQARQAYANAIVSFRSRCPTIKRTGSANYGQGKTSYTYAQLPDAIEQIQTLLGECQLAVTWQTPQQTPTWIQVTCTITHVLGHSESTTLGGPPETSGSKNQLQSIKSTWSYLRRTTLWSLLGLVDKDEVDDDGAGGKTTQAPKPKAQELADEAKAKAEGKLTPKQQFIQVCRQKAQAPDMPMDAIKNAFEAVSKILALDDPALCLEYVQRDDVEVHADGTVQKKGE